ncbi:hypothetical protein CYLTODRAFT_491763 [Cylindrobasidium torrendii FP15055 ss-10]|uniref:Uncharacterized protein n=1 Tax=Cylindrobasidium torrendii FP15055 ss-10 TaxID=1314674 RepID=A0A0D7B7B1_9AGAR|nr:hypothetical protein CYLTODRAFT_491763 [Cylindrobasidium torrendii FP15055 ss-10]
MSPPFPPSASASSHTTPRIRETNLVGMHDSDCSLRLRPPPPPPKVLSRRQDQTSSTRGNEFRSFHSSRDDSWPSDSPARSLKRRLSMDDDGCELFPLLNGGERPAFIDCDTCGVRVPLREQATGQYTVRHWLAHQALCHLPTPYSAPVKRQRGYRTEEERIHDLENDPYVQAFEPYVVHCKLCDKWIRLLSRSRYSTSPWEAHRKSCLAKKIASENSKLLELDPCARKFDAERVLCASCDKWIAITDNRNLWEVHKERCREATLPTVVVENSVISTTPLARPIMTTERPHSHLVPPSGQTPTLRRNLEQREAHLRSDPFIKIVEEHRVFCSLCQKWVGLRQNSRFYTYPWTRHRRACLARNSDCQTARERVLDSEQRLSSGPQGGEDAGGSVDEDIQETHRPFARDTSHPAITDLNARAKTVTATTYKSTISSSSQSSSVTPRQGPPKDGRETSSRAPCRDPAPPKVTTITTRPGTKVSTVKYDVKEEFPSREDEAALLQTSQRFPDGRFSKKTQTRPPSPLRGRMSPAGRRLSNAESYLDLDAPSNRITHLAFHIVHLLQTTFRSGASIHAIVRFLNASMPVARWKEFDMREVIAGVGLLARDGIKVDEDEWRLELAGDFVRRC